MKPPPGMEEVYEHEGTIRQLLPKLKGNKELRDDATRILKGPPLVGSRLVKLRQIAKELTEATS